MKILNIIFIIIVIVVLIIGAIVFFWKSPLTPPSDESMVYNTVTQFGSRLKSVALSAPNDQLVASIQEQYGSLVTPEILAGWKQDAAQAPGRLTLSPWPDSIEITSVKKSNETYVVEGNIIEVTSTEVNNGSVANKVPIILTLEKRNNTWLISSFSQTNQVSKGDLIKVTTPLPNESVTSPLKIEGQARGTWYFEAFFPVKLLDANGKVLAQAPAQAQGDWMSNEYVPFTVTLTFSKPTTPLGTLVLEKDNPSGLPENADEFRIPVYFNTTN